MGSELMIDWVQKASKGDFESSSTKTPEFKAFYKTTSAWLKKFAKEHGLTDLVVKDGHFSVTATFRVGVQWWYLSTNDVRCPLFNSALLRTTAGPKDYVGGYNQWVAYDANFESSLLDTINGNHH